MLDVLPLEEEHWRVINDGLSNGSFPEGVGLPIVEVVKLVDLVHAVDRFVLEYWFLVVLVD